MELNGLSLPLCSGGTLDLLQGGVPFSADHVQVTLEGL